MNPKSAWAWICGMASGPLMCYVPYIAKWDFSHIPGETHGAAVLTFLTGIGLINMKRPADHEDPKV